MDMFKADLHTIIDRIGVDHFAPMFLYGAALAYASSQVHRYAVLLPVQTSLCQQELGQMGP